MSDGEAESRKAAGEARLDVLSRAGQPGAGNRYDALLRYLRGIYTRPPKERQSSEDPRTAPAEK